MMRVDSRQLLRRLEPAVRPAGPGPSQAGSTPIDRAGFDDLLARAGRGEFQSGRELDDTALEEPLDPAVRERISRIADAAEVAGHERILVIAGDQPLLLGVSERRVDGELKASTGVGDTSDRLQTVEAAVRIRIEEEKPGDRKSPVIHVVPPAIADAILAGDDRSQDQDINHRQHDTRDDAA
jgi:hypothetical protein